MSTRSQLRFIEGGKVIANVYRHSDGYPDGIIPDLVKFIQWYTGKPFPRSLYDMSYTSANWIYWNKLQLQKYDDEGRQVSKLGFGILPAETIQSDVEYLYQFDGETLHVSEHIWGGDILTWKSIPWAFVGTLIQAYRRFVVQSCKMGEVPLVVALED